MAGQIAPPLLLNVDPQAVVAMVLAMAAVPTVIIEMVSQTPNTVDISSNKEVTTDTNPPHPPHPLIKANLTTILP